MNKKPTVTVAIPAWNEEAGITGLLSSIKSQKQTNHKVAEIIVYSDGSTDNMVSLIKNNFKDVKVIDSKKNMGKNIRINQMMRNNRSDILIQADADVRINNSSVFDNLVAPLVLNSNIGISCAYHNATLPSTFVGRLSFFGFRVWDRSRNSLGKRGVRYYCEGGLRAFSRKFTQEFRLPTGYHVGEDSYSFYYAVTHGFLVKVAIKAKVYIDLAENLTDYLSQMRRFLQDPGMVETAFGDSTALKYETMTAHTKLVALCTEFVKSPVTGACYLALQSYARASAKYHHPQKSWTPISRRK